MTPAYDRNAEFALFLLMAAPAIGSFLGVLAMRLPAGKPVFVARSACDRCGALLEWRDLIPLLSAVLLRLRCRHCHGSIAPLHPLVEFAALIPPLVSMQMLSGWQMLAADVAGWTLIALATLAWRSRSSGATD